MGAGKFENNGALFTLRASSVILILSYDFDASTIFDIHRAASFIGCSSMTS